MWIRHWNIKSHCEVQHNIKVYKCKFICNLYVFCKSKNVAQKLLFNNAFYKYLLATYEMPDTILDSGIHL